MDSPDLGQWSVVAGRASEPDRPPTVLRRPAAGVQTAGTHAPLALRTGTTIRCADRASGLPRVPLSVPGRRRGRGRGSGLAVDSGPVVPGGGRVRRPAGPRQPNEPGPSGVA